MRVHGVARARMIATEACRSAANGVQFLEEVRDRLGIQLEIVDRETEAHLAAAGCGALADQQRAIDRPVRHRRRFVGNRLAVGRKSGGDEQAAGDSTAQRIRAWESLRLGVVTLAEKFGGHEVSDDTFAAMTRFVADQLAPFAVAGGGRGALRAFSSAGHFGHGHDDRRRSSEFAALRSPANRRAVADQRRSRCDDRQAARDDLRAALGQSLHRP